MGPNTNLRIFLGFVILFFREHVCACVCVCNSSFYVCVCAQYSEKWSGGPNSRPTSCFGAKRRLTVAEPLNLSLKQAICYTVSLPLQAPAQLSPCKLNKPSNQPQEYTEHTLAEGHIVLQAQRLRSWV